MRKHNINIKKAVNKAVLLAIPMSIGCGIATLASCTDEHFDINADVQGQQTIWKNIEQNENLSAYANILKSVYYSQTEDKTTKETYADILNGDQTFTVWAPVNGSFDSVYYKNLIATGIRDSIYKVENNLIRNNLARFSYIYNGTDSIKIDLFNNKSAWINYNQNTIKGNLVTTPNIGASNGVLHITEAPVQYQPNLYEYMATLSELDSLNSFIKKYQTTEFDEYSSTQGPTVDGKITWVDSITITNNFYTNKYLNAYLNREDSNYVMIMPTNETWKNTLEKTKQYFKFKSSYKQDIYTLTEEGKDTTISGIETTFSQYELDSLTNLYSKNAICENLVYNANWQYEQIPITNIKSISNADSLKTTSGNKLKKTGTLNETNNSYSTFEIDNFATLFGDKDPIECSNGYAYIVDDWKFPSTVIAPTITLSGISSYESHDNNSNDPQAKQVSYSANNYVYEDGEFTIVSDTTFKYDYIVMTGTSETAKAKYNFALPNVQSCKYDIFVVIGYNAEIGKLNRFKATISYDNETKRLANQALKNPIDSLIDAEGNKLGGTNYFENQAPSYGNKNGKYSLEVLDTICLAKDFEFPVCYYGLENAYPTVSIQAYITSKNKHIFTNEMWINGFILKAKEW
ncbi:MAG: hypothetical protein K6E54_11430 [Bacteroidaceae bacterium]|nr:hypothetical protein [Bacteroidaceae bacterium]